MVATEKTFRDYKFLSVGFFGENKRFTVTVFYGKFHDQKYYANLLNLLSFTKMSFYSKITFNLISENNYFKSYYYSFNRAGVFFAATSDQNGHFLQTNLTRFFYFKVKRIGVQA